MRLLRFSAWFLGSMGALAGFMVLGLWIYMDTYLPDVTHLKNVQFQEPLRVYTQDGHLISEIGGKRRYPADFKSIPPLLTKAVLATEDRRFYDHQGVDFIGLARAFSQLVVTGEKRQGGSTITMQVARNFYLTRKKTYLRKLNEILLAFKIESELTKDQILALYLNKIYFGNRAYGVTAAAQIYYGKTLSELTLPQMAMIAGLPQAPSSVNPINNPSAAFERRRHVLTRMHRYGYIDQTQFDDAVGAPITASYHEPKEHVNAPYISEMVRQYMTRLFGEEAYTNGYKVYTTINANLQTAANQALQAGLQAYDRRHGYRGPVTHVALSEGLDVNAVLKTVPKWSNLRAGLVTQVDEKAIQVKVSNEHTVNIAWSGLSWARPYLSATQKGPRPQSAADIVKPGDVVYTEETTKGWRLTQQPQIEGALVSVKPQNGAVLALIGGFSFEKSKFNRATQALRQPGSSFKPFIYSAALENGYTPASMVNDAPIVLKSSYHIWRPQNDNRRFVGATRLRMGLAKSMNLISVRLLQNVGIHTVHDYVQKFGFNPESLSNDLSLALGSNTISPLQLAAAYSTFANGGYKIQPYYIDRITTARGEVLFSSNPVTVPGAIVDGNTPIASRAISAQNAYLMSHMLQDVIRVGTGRRARALGRSDLAGKTGTTNDQHDGWFAGFTPLMVTTVWVGFDTPKPTGEYSSKLALPIWVDYMQTALAHVPEQQLMRPEGLITVKIDPSTGLLASPGQRNAIFETFRVQNAPKQYAVEYHREKSIEGIF